MNGCLRPKLVLPDAAEALRWYEATLAAHVRTRYVLGDDVVFAEVEMLGGVVTLKDADHTDPVPRPGPILDVVVEDPDALAGRLTAGGAEVLIAVDDQFYGARAGRLLDPFGVQWLISTETTMSPEEFQEAFG